MRHAISRYSAPFVTILVMAAIATTVAVVILGHLRVHLPGWFPVGASHFVEYRAELATAQSITPGQGQTVNVAGVPVGEIARVDLEGGRAVVTMKIRRKYTPLHRDASILVRPKTGLNDMILELSPGTRAAGALAGGGTIPVSRTLPNVNPDEVLSALDADTRAYLQLLIGGAGEGLAGQGERLSASLRRLDPSTRETSRILGALRERRRNIRHTVSNFRALAEALGARDKDLAGLVDSSNAVFGALARQDAGIRDSLSELPGTLEATDAGLTKADALARRLGPTLQGLRPAARALGPALADARPFLRDTTPVIRDELRPFARDALPAVKDLRPAAGDLRGATPDLRRATDVLNYALNTLAYDKPGDGNQSFLFWASWASHIGNSVLATQDAHGPIRHGVVLLSCSTITTLQALQRANQELAVLLGLLNVPFSSCPNASKATR